MRERTAVRAPRTAAAALSPQPAESQRRGRETNLAQENDQRQDQQRHRGDEQQRDRYRNIWADKSANEENDNDRADQQGARRTQADRTVDQLGAARQYNEIGGGTRAFAAVCRSKQTFEFPPAIDDARQPASQHRQDRAYACQQENRRDRKLNHVRDRDDLGVVQHKFGFCLVRIDSGPGGLKVAFRES